MAYTVALPDGRTVEFPDDLPKDKAAEVIRQQFPNLGAPETTLLGNVKELVKGVLPGAVGLVESAATGASALLPEDMEKTAREKIKSVATSAKQPFTAGAGYEESVGRRLGEGLGSIIPAVPLAFMGAPGVAAGIGMGLASGAGEARTRAEGEGATAEQRSRATALGTIPGGFDTAIDMALAALPGGVGKSLSVVRRALVSGGVEGATEAAQAIAQNAIAKGVYKPSQALLEGSGEEGAYGAGVGALASVLLDMAIPGRRAQKPSTPTPPPPAEPGPQIAPEAPVGTQGALFTEEEMGERIPTPKEEPAPPATNVVPQGEQLDLGLDFQREYPDLLTEINALKAQPQTPEVKGRIAELNDMILGLHEQEVAAIRAEKQVDAETRDMFPGLSEEPAQASLFPEIDVVRPAAEAPTPVRQLTQKQEEARRRLQETQDQEAATAAQKEQERKGGQYRLPLRTVPEDRNVGRNLQIPARPDEITMQDLEDLGLPMRSAKGWLQQNVVGKTPAEIRVLVGNNPDLLLQKGTRAQVLKYLTAPVPESFKEEPSGTKTTPTNLPKPRPQPRGGKPSVEVSGEPTSPELLQPGAGVPTAAGAPTTPDGLGLAPAGQPAGKGAPAAGGAQPTLNAPVTPTPVATPAMDLSAAKQFGMDDTSKDVGGSDYPKCSFKRIIMRSVNDNGCAQMKHAMLNGATLEEPLWRGALSIAVRCEDGASAIHKLSQSHPEYTPEATEAKAAETKGPYTCEWYRDNNPAL